MYTSSKPFAVLKAANSRYKIFSRRISPSPVVIACGPMVLIRLRANV
jgi:hypothetical protein